MSYRLESLQKIIFDATHCYMTMPDGERINYTFKRGVVKALRVAGGRVAPFVFVTPQDRPFDTGGWYPANALYFVMPDGEIVR